MIKPYLLKRDRFRIPAWPVGQEVRNDKKMRIVKPIAIVIPATACRLSYNGSAKLESKSKMDSVSSTEWQKNENRKTNNLKLISSFWNRKRSQTLFMHNPQTDELLSVFAKEVKEGLSAFPKYLSSKYFYDATGDKLFQDIMAMPEYYLTDAEFAIFTEHKSHIAELFISDKNSRK